MIGAISETGAKYVKLPKPLDHQLPILLSPKRYKLVAAGRRFGKSLLGLVAVLSGHGPVGKPLKGALEGGTIWWVAPNYPIANLIWRHLKRATQGAWTYKNETERRIALPGGGSVTVKSAENPDSLRGSGLDGVVNDEAAFMAQEAWTQAIRPALSDRQGWAMFLSTPNRHNWFYELFKNGGLEENEEWEVWQKPTSDNPLILAAEILDAKKILGSLVFNQEYLAEFTATSGGLFRREWFEIIERNDVPKGMQLTRYWDMAATKPKKGQNPDWTVGALVGEKEGIYYILDIRRFRESPATTEAEVFRAAVEDGVGVSIWMEQEPGSGSIIAIDQYRRKVLKGFDFRADKKSVRKEEAWKPLSAAAEAENVKMVRAYWNKPFLDEAEAAPPDSDGHDDQLDAVSGAVNKLALTEGYGGQEVW